MFRILFASGENGWHTKALVLFVTEEDAGRRCDALSTELCISASWLATSPALAEFSAAKATVGLAYAPVQSAFPRIVFAGLGKQAQLSQQSELLNALREAAGAAARFCRDMHFEEFAFSLPDLFSLAPGISRERMLKEAVCGAAIGLYRQTRFKSNREALLEEKPDPARLLLLGTTSDEPLMTTAEQAVAEADGVLFAKELINGPANIITPTYLAEEASKLAGQHPKVMSCRVLTPAHMKEAGMNALLAVSAGASQEPRLIILEYAPRDHEKDDPIVLIGKGLTFDSGGISLKPAAGMEAMKDDMSGAAAVLGLFHAIARLRPGKRIIGLMPCTENMPGGTATRPGDVITTLSGQTVEIVNTDAEGRLALCDTLSYAQKYWHPAFMVDLATLTGACVVALGQHVAGLFCQDNALSQQIIQRGELVGERYWPLPLWDMYFETLKSTTADFANSGTREGGACSAAAFLSRFVEKDIRWAHLDIAGPAYDTSSKDVSGGARGFAVRTLIELIAY